MTLEEMFCDFYEKYGDDFNWRMLPFSDKGFVEELKRELGEDNLIFDKEIYAVAKSDSSDDVLYLIDNKNGNDIYRIYHLSYSSNNIEGFPKYIEICGIKDLKDYIDKRFVEEFV